MSDIARIRQLALITSKTILRDGVIDTVQRHAQEMLAGCHDHEEEIVALKLLTDSIVSNLSIIIGLSCRPVEEDV